MIYYYYCGPINFFLKKDKDKQKKKLKKRKKKLRIMATFFLMIPDYIALLIHLQQNTRSHLHRGWEAIFLLKIPK